MANLAFRDSNSIYIYILISYIYIYIYKILCFFCSSSKVLYSDVFLRKEDE